jgi:hypothetical protein
MIGSHSEAAANSKLSAFSSFRPATSTAAKGNGRQLRRNRNRSPGMMASRFCWKTDQNVYAKPGSCSISASPVTFTSVRGAPYNRKTTDEALLVLP